MVSIEKCKAELKNSNRKYSDEEIKKIRDLLYQIATIEYDKFKEESTLKSIDVQKGLHR